MKINIVKTTSIETSSEPVGHKKKHVNYEILNRIPGGGKDVREKVILLFQAEIPAFTRDLRKFLKNRDWKSLGSAAHKLKSTSKWLGVTKLVELLHLIEVSTLEESNLPLLPKLVDEAEIICRIIQNELEQDRRRSFKT